MLALEQSEQEQVPIDPEEVEGMRKMTLALLLLSAFSQSRT